MMNEARLNEYYSDIASRLSGLIPCQWTRAVLGYITTKGCDTCTFYFFTDDGQRHYYAEIIENYGVDEDEFDEAFWELWDVIGELQDEFKDVEETWTSFTFELDSENHFKAEYGYEEKAPSGMLGNMRWAYEKLGVIPEDDCLKEKLDQYRETGILTDFGDDDDEDDYEDDEENESKLEKLQNITCYISEEEAGYRERVLEKLRDDEELREQVMMLCCMEFLDELEPLESIDEDYSFNMDGEIFAEDGGGGYYAFLEDGSIGYVNFAENECGRVTMTLKEMLNMQANCAYSWHNYATKKFSTDIEHLRKFIYGLEEDGREQYMDAFGDEAPEYDELRDKLAEVLELKVIEESQDIVDEILIPFYEFTQKEPVFLAADDDNEVLNGLIH